MCYTGRNNSHISKNHCGIPKAGSRVWSIPLGKVHNKVFRRCHAVVGWASSICSGGFFKNLHLSGTVNKQNFRYWAAENPRELHARPLHSPKVTVWCTLSSIGVIEPHFFEEGGVTVTVNANRYCDMSENFLRPKIDEYGEEHNLEDFWLQWMELRPIQHVVRAQFWRRCSRVEWSPYTRQFRGHRARLI
jgi:hypothetical protein